MLPIKFNDPLGSKLPALEQNILKCRPMQMLLVMFYAEELKRDAINLNRVPEGTKNIVDRALSVLVTDCAITAAEKKRCPMFAFSDRRRQDQSVAWKPTWERAWEPRKIRPHRPRGDLRHNFAGIFRGTADGAGFQSDWLGGLSLGKGDCHENAVTWHIASVDSVRHKYSFGGRVANERVGHLERDSKSLHRNASHYNSRQQWRLSIYLRGHLWQPHARFLLPAERPHPLPAHCERCHHSRLYR